MVKCPYCQHENQEGTLYCEQCKSDLTPAEAPIPVSPLEEVPMVNVVEGIPLAPEPEGKHEPFAALAEAIPVEAIPVPELAAQQAAAARPEPVSEPVAKPVEPPPAATAATADKLSPDAKPRLVVLRGMKINSEYPLYEGLNFIGRADEKPVDIDLEDQESPDRIWSSRQ